VLAAGIAVVLLFAIATDVMFVQPSTDRPTGADAVIVLGGDGHRLALAMRLMSDSVAPVLAQSIGSPYDPCFRRHEPYKVICFRADPFTTQGEARWIATMAATEGWRKVVVVVSDPQVTRARLRIRRCYHDGLQIVAVPVSAKRTVVDVVYEWGAWAKAMTLQRSC